MTARSLAKSWWVGAKTHISDWSQTSTPKPGLRFGPKRLVPCVGGGGGAACGLTREVHPPLSVTTPAQHCVQLLLEVTSVCSMLSACPSFSAPRSSAFHSVPLKCRPKFSKPLCCLGRQVGCGSRFPAARGRELSLSVSLLSATATSQDCLSLILCLIPFFSGRLRQQSSAPSVALRAGLCSTHLTRFAVGPVAAERQGPALRNIPSCPLSISTNPDAGVG